MENNSPMHPDNLERYAFYWSGARMFIAAIALFLGGYPPIYKIMPSMFSSQVGSLLTVAWIISGVAAAYLLYRFMRDGKQVFGGKNPRDIFAFFVMVVTGFNLGIAGFLGLNIGMKVAMQNSTLFMVTGILYLLTLGYLCKRWNESGNRLFASAEKASEGKPDEKVTPETEAPKID